MWDFLRKKFCACTTNKKNYIKHSSLDIYIYIYIFICFYPQGSKLWFNHRSANLLVVMALRRMVMSVAIVKKRSESQRHSLFFFLTFYFIFFCWVFWLLCYEFNKNLLVYYAPDVRAIVAVGADVYYSYFLVSQAKCYFIFFFKIKSLTTKKQRTKFIRSKRIF